jgi:UDP-N-acetylmuramoyl-tripeptide--D-alanyl-D-alanine ligase
MNLELARVAQFVSAGGEFDGHLEARGYSIDSRTIRKGELFFAVKGENNDGHDYVESALQRGAVAAVVGKQRSSGFSKSAALLVVDDVLAALQTLALSVRRLWAKPLIAVTGSAGKTTTKDAIAHVLSRRFRVLKSQGNFNNHFGLPLTLLALESADELAVIEMGMSHEGEIRLLAKIAQPDVGVVTNVHPVHLEFFRSIADIARAKYELIQALPAGGTAILNSDDAYVAQFGRDFAGRVIMFGSASYADVRVENIQTGSSGGSEFDVVVGAERERTRLALLGTHSIYNALASVAAAIAVGVPFRAAVGELASMVPADKRGEVVQLGNITVVNDCYNSNPKALDAMVDALLAMPARRRIVVAGEMLELGPAAEQLHRESGQRMAEKNIDLVVGVRGLAESLVDAARRSGARAEFVTTPEAAGEFLRREARAGDVVLLKASRGVKLERALETWRPASKSN